MKFFKTLFYLFLTFLALLLILAAPALMMGIMYLFALYIMVKVLFNIFFNIDD